MSTHQYIQSLLATENRLAEYFIKIGEYYKTEPGIYYGCQEMASISNDHIREIRKKSVKYKIYQNEPNHEYPQSMIKDHELGNDLFGDLLFMWFLSMEAAMFNNLLVQSSSNDSETDPEDTYGDFERETEKQSQWLMYRINMTARKTTADV